MSNERLYRLKMSLLWSFAHCIKFMLQIFRSYGASLPVYPKDIEPQRGDIFVAGGGNPRNDRNIQY